MAIRADPATIARAATDTETARQEAADQLRGLYNTVVNNSPNWQGQSGTRFQRLMEGWNKQTDDLVRAMDDIAEMLGTTGNELLATDDQQGQGLGKFADLYE